MSLPPLRQKVDTMSCESSPLPSNLLPSKGALATSSKGALATSSKGVGRQNPLKRAWRPVRGRIFDLAWSSNNERLCTAGENSSLIFSVERSEPCPIAKLFHQDGATDAASMRCTWHPGGHHVLIGTVDGTVSVHDASDGCSLASMRVTSDEDEIYGLCFLSNAGLIGVGVSDTVQQWDLPSGRQTALTELSAIEAGNLDQRAYVFSVAARGRVLAAALSDGSCRLLDAQSLAPVFALTEHVTRGSSCFACALSPTTAHLATAAADGTVLLYDLRMLKRGPIGELHGHPSAVHSVTFAAPGALLGSLAQSSGAGELLLSGGDDATLRVADTIGCEYVCSLRTAGPVLCTAVDHEHARIASGGGSGACAADNAISLWSSSAGAAASVAARSATCSAGNEEAVDDEL